MLNLDVRTIAVASGKGGTGKTMVATNIAMMLPDCHLIDCDVEEPNAHLFLDAQIESQQKVFAEVPEVDQAACDGCGDCAEICRFQALARAKKTIITFPELCHSCGACYAVCGKRALKPSFHELGEIRTGSFRGTHAFSDGLLKIGQVRSAEVIRRLVSRRSWLRTTVRDCPPGTSCSMVAAVKGSDVAVLVTEPTPFGLHDLQAAVQTLEWLGIPHCVVINKCDLGFPATEEYCHKNQIPIVGRIPFTREIARIVSTGELLVDHGKAYRDLFGELISNIMQGNVRTVQRNHQSHEPPATSFDLFDRCKSRTGAGHTIAIISGKGGTGKTTFSASFAALMDDTVVADCDVDAANLHLLLDAQIREKHYFRSSYVAEVNADKCSGCRMCVRACRFNAISIAGGKAVIDPLECEGCGTCVLACPKAGEPEENPITIRESIDGEAYKSASRHGDFVHAEMYPGGEASGKLVTLLRQSAEDLARETNKHDILIDASPGVGCPVNASILGADLAVIVTEPSVSAVHDLERVFKLLAFFRIEASVIINRHDLNPDLTAKVEEHCAAAGAEVIGRVPFDRQIVDAMAQGVPPVLYECKSKDAITEIFQKIAAIMRGNKNATR